MSGAYVSFLLSSEGDLIGFALILSEFSTAPLVLVKDDIAVPVPKHKEIKRGLLIEIISEAGLTKEEFLELTK
jgi:hypothetical protein